MASQQKGAGILDIPAVFRAGGFIETVHAVVAVDMSEQALISALIKASDDDGSLPSDSRSAQTPAHGHLSDCTCLQRKST